MLVLQHPKEHFNPNSADASPSARECEGSSKIWSEFHVGVTGKEIERLRDLSLDDPNINAADGEAVTPWPDNVLFFPCYPARLKQLEQGPEAEPARIEWNLIHASFLKKQLEREREKKAEPASPLLRMQANDIHEEIKGREFELVKAAGLSWPPKKGNPMLCPMPDHEDTHPSWRWDEKKARYFCTCGNGSAIDVVMALKGLDFNEAVDWARKTLGLRGNGSAGPHTTSTRTNDDTGQRAYALRIWEEAGPLAGTIGERYFRETRKIDPSAVLGMMRFHPAVKALNGQTHPAIINTMRKGYGGEIVAIHATFVGPNGERPDITPRKQYFGRWGETGAAIYLARPGDNTVTLEGIEKTMAAMNALGFPGVTGGCKGAMAAMNVAPEIRTLFIGGDYGAENEAEKLAARAHEAGREVRFCYSPVADLDWDECEAEAVRATILNAPLWEPGPEPKSTRPKERASVKPEALPDSLPPVAPFDFDLLPHTLRAWARDIVETMQAPPDFAAVAIMTGLGSILGRKVGIRPKKQDGWTEVANQWAIGIGRPGILKTPSIDAALAPVRYLEAQAFAKYEKTEGEGKTAAKIAKLRAKEREKAARKKLQENSDAEIDGFFETDEEEPPKLRRYSTTDSTPAALAALHVENHNGLLVHRDEVVSLLQSLDWEDNSEGRGFYLTGWGGNSSWTTDRIGRGMHLHIPAVCLSVLGSTQPGKIASYLATARRGGAGDDGLIQRFGLMVWPDVDPDWKDIDRPLNAEAKRAAFAMYKRLDDLDPRSFGAKQDIGFDGEPEGIPYLRFDDEALEIFRDWRGGLERRLRSGELHPTMESHLAKYRKLVPGLALISHLADRGDGPVKATAIRRALAWAEYLETHARRAYASVIMPEADAAKAIVAKIKSGALGKSDPTIQNGARRFTSTDVWRPGWSRLDDKNEVHRALELLVEYHWLDVVKEETGGRPVTYYLVSQEIVRHE